MKTLEDTDPIPSARSPVEDALEMVAIGPRKTVEWIEVAQNMCKHCREHEDVDQSAARILAAEVRRLGSLMAFSDAVRIARGCLDYSGGHRADEGHLEIYHHGIQTVINALESVEEKGLDSQAQALWNMGKKETA